MIVIVRKEVMVMSKTVVASAAVSFRYQNVYLLFAALCVREMNLNACEVGGAHYFLPSSSFSLVIRLLFSPPGPP